MYSRVEDLPQQSGDVEHIIGFLEICKDSQCMLLVMDSYLVLQPDDLVYCASVPSEASLVLVKPSPSHIIGADL